MLSIRASIIGEDRVLVTLTEHLSVTEERSRSFEARYRLVPPPGAPSRFSGIPPFEPELRHAIKARIIAALAS